MSGKSIYKNRNKRCDRLATHVFLFSAKNRIYKQNTHTHIHKVELKTLHFNFDSPLQKRFLRSISRKRLTIEVSALSLDELMVLRAVSQLIMRGHKPKVE